MRKAVRAIIIRDKNLLTMHRNKFGKEYFTLVGGGVHIGESTEQALIREVQEETGLKIDKYDLVFIEEAGEPYGTQYVYLCDDPGGEVALQPDADESKISAMGKNIYKPVWLPIKDLEKTEFLSHGLRKAIQAGLNEGFPKQTITLN